MLTETQCRMLKLIRVYGDMPPDAESTLGIQGAAFDKVEYALERRGFIVDRQITDTGEAALKAYRMRAA
jgi:hypothetical protein